jgi:hypothetical protein
MAKVKDSESYVGFDSESKPKKGRQIIGKEPSAIVATTKVHPDEPDEAEEGENLFHSQMWVKGTLLHFIIDNGSHKKFISTEVIKQLDITISPHLQSSTFVWLC